MMYLLHSMQVRSTYDIDLLTRQSCPGTASPRRPDGHPLSGQLDTHTLRLNRVNSHRVRTYTR